MNHPHPQILRLPVLPLNRQLLLLLISVHYLEFIGQILSPPPLLYIRQQPNLGRVDLMHLSLKLNLIFLNPLQKIVLQLRQQGTSHNILPPGHPNFLPRLGHMMHKHIHQPLFALNSLVLLHNQRRVLFSTHNLKQLPLFGHKTLLINNIVDIRFVLRQ